jgi:hypothetical protein
MMTGTVRVLYASRADVRAGNTRPLVQALRRATATRAAWQRLQGAVVFALEGWESDPREIYEIPEVRRYWAALDAAFPAWSFFAVPGQVLRAFALCVLPDVRMLARSQRGAPWLADVERSDVDAFIERTVVAVTQAAGVHHVDAARLQRYRTALLQSFGRSDSLM